MTGESDRPPQASFAPIQKQRAFELVLAQIESQIVDGRLRPGSRLPDERSLSAQLHVSRPSVREAVRVLEALNIVDVKQASGNAGGSTISGRAGETLSRLLRIHVALGHFTHEEFVELRRILNIWSVRIAAVRRSEDELANLRTLQAEMIAVSHDPVAYLALNARFHVEVAAATGNALLTHLMQALSDAVEHDTAVSATERSDWPAAVEWSSTGHQRIIDAIASHDPDEAEAAQEYDLDYHLQDKLPSTDEPPPESSEPPR